MLPRKNEAFYVDAAPAPYETNISGFSAFFKARADSRRGIRRWAEPEASRHPAGRRERMGWKKGNPCLGFEWRHVIMSIDAPKQTFFLTSPPPRACGFGGFRRACARFPAVQHFAMEVPWRPA